MKKTLLTALCLFIAWNLLVAWLPKDDQPSHSLWNGNLITAERAIFDVASFEDKTVVLGSSCAAGLAFDSSIVNLSLAGLSIYDGQLVLSKLQEMPRSVWIEANVVQRPPSVDFAKMFRGTFRLRGNLPGLRTQNQPVAVAERFYEWSRPRLKARILGRPAVTDLPDTALSVTELSSTGTVPATMSATVPEIDSAWLSGLQRDREQPITGDELKTALERLRALIAILEEADVKVAFFEMPQHPSLCESPQVTSMRRAVKAEFSEIPYLDSPDCDEYTTSDGIHLTKRSAISYSDWLVTQMNRLADRS